MLLEVYDLESLSNLFTYTGYRPKTNEWFQYIICPWRNDGEELYNHLTNNKFVQCGLTNFILFFLDNCIKIYLTKLKKLNIFII